MKFKDRKFYIEAPKELQEELVIKAESGVGITIRVATQVAGEMVEQGTSEDVAKFFNKYNCILTAQDQKKKKAEPVPVVEAPEEDVIIVERPSEEGRIVAYMRLSRKEAMDKNGFRRQLSLIESFNPEKVYQDVISGAIKNRPELDKMLDELQVGDVVVIPSVDRLSRSTLDLLDLVETIKNKGAMLKSVNEPWLDTTSSNPMASFLLTIMGAFSQLERDMIADRIKKGCEVARENGVKFGRPLQNGDKVQHAIDLYVAKEMSTRQIEKKTGVSRSTLMRRVKELKEKGEL